MRRLSTEGIKQVAQALNMTEEMAEEVVSIFCSNPSFRCAEDFIQEWEDHWHRENNWVAYYNYEKEYCYSDYENPEEVFATIESFKEWVSPHSYELNCNGMIIVSY